MATIVEPKLSQESQRFLLHNISWETYETFLSVLGDRPIRLTYDQGNLELMSASQTHEFDKWTMGRLIEMLTFELDIPILSGGSTTFKHKEFQRGLEPDECYWIANESVVRGKLEVDLTCDPPPDLAVEIDVTRSSLKRQSIYAALGVPELWCFDGKTLRVHELQPNGE